MLDDYEAVNSTTLLKVVREALVKAENALLDTGASALTYGEALGELAAAVSDFDDWMSVHRGRQAPVQWLDFPNNTELPPF